MLCLESSFLVDWFRGQEYAREYLQTVEGDTRLLVPTLVLHELFVGVHTVDSAPASTTAIYQALESTKFVGFTPAAAEEATVIRTTLRDQGERIGPFDALVAGVARDAGATLVATDEHFARVDELAVHNPRS